MASTYEITAEEYYGSNFYTIRAELMDTLDFDSDEAEAFMNELLKTA